MKRLAASLAVSISCLATTAVTASATAPRDDLVSGTGQGVFWTGFGPFASQAHVNAKGDATDAHGHTWARFFDTPLGDVLIKGAVHCLNVEGNQAIIGTIVEESNTTLVPPGTAVFRKVIDNGQGSNDPPDQTGTISLFPPPPTCPPPSAFAFIETGPVEQGNYVVKDGR